MPSVSVSGKYRRKVRFPSSSRPIPPVSHKKILRQSGDKDSHGDGDQYSVSGSKDQAPRKQRSKMAVSEEHPSIPRLFKEPPPIRDSLSTETSELQYETLEKCLPFLKGTESSLIGSLNEHGVPALQKDDHIEYLYDSLEDYPSNFVGIDSSRPWMAYWALAGLSLLGEDVTKYRERVITTFTPMQNATGGFGGGHGQLSHCASSYAAVLCLAMVGGEDAFSIIDREAMWRWLGDVKQPDGGFQMSVGGEEDVRGAYCAMVVISLLDLPLELPPEAAARQAGLDTFLSGLPEYLARCQTFEGGISGSPGTEAHGAYAFCVLACLCILGKPEETIARYMDIPLLLSWLSARQYAPEGGFSGRTNKLVDGCYSHWVGGCWPLLQAALNGTQSLSQPVQPSVGSLYSREGLTRYILACCQSKRGGLRDKPGKYPDSYHTCYTLTGLSSLQNFHFHTDDSSASRSVFSSAFSWKYTPIVSSSQVEADVNVFDERDRLQAFHPIYSIPHKAAENMRAWFESRSLVL
ncbi:hypothetical protein DTO195F2_6106 [Paecilomyces variotii]|nr:hypothetical protein DTO195F2_6106 [Paecilomyces variotii]